ncbi:MAG: hypothetical protein M3419_09155 [Actinomycetota bacterium]|nr:hypothetical protein [Actinomycetota bacterium]
MSVEHARAVADAVLYEGYLLYPYRASSSKNQSRWQFGVLGPPGAVEAGCGEDPVLASEFLIAPLEPAVAPTVTLHLRFLQLQKRSALQVAAGGELEEVPELVVGASRWLSWDEAVERELTLGPWPLDELAAARVEPVHVPAGEDIEPVRDEAGVEVGRLVRSRRSLHGQVRVRAEVVDGGRNLVRLSVGVENVATGAAGDKESAISASFIGAHLLLGLERAEFVSMTDPPDEAAGAAAACEQHRCWPVLAGPEGDRSLLLVSPIILYDHPELAPQSAGALYDSTEIDEILTLRVMTLTDDEKAAARATDPRAAEIIDRCDALTPQEMQQMHGILRDPHALEQAMADIDVTGSVDLTTSHGFDDEVPWWDPAVDGSVSPDTDEVLINGVRVCAGSIVRVHPSRRADAQDLFFAGQVARVTAVHSDVDGETHVAVVLVDDPAADLHDWYGRYLYFAPDELEPIPGSGSSSARPGTREESRS